MATQQFSFSLEEEVLIEKILLTHDPDGRHFDCKLLLGAVETIMNYTTASQVSDNKPDAHYTISCSEADGLEEPLGHTIYKISREMLHKCYEEGNVFSRTLDIFDLVRKYRWDAKLLLVLSAFTIIFCEVWIIKQSQNTSPLAAEIALLKQLPKHFNHFRPLFKAVNLLFEAMVQVITKVIKFEDLPIRHVELDDNTITATKSLIHAAAHWVVRSSVTCTSQIINLRVMEDSKYPFSVSSALWELSSLQCRVSSFGTQLGSQVDACQQKIEWQMHQKILNIFKETHEGNQEVLQMLFALRNELPLTDSTSHKMSTSALEKKVVLFLISEPELLLTDELLLLLQQTYDHPLHNKLDGSYEIVWVPVNSSEKWTDDEVIIFNYLQSTLPWYSIRQPWSLSSTTIKHIRQEWEFNGKPLMVVLDPLGAITNVNAIDMVWIWGAKAYPFSTSREQELWEEEKWTLRLVINELNPLLTMWVEEERVVCIYGSNNLDWIKEFNTMMKEIRSATQVEVVYVGNKKLGDQLSNIVHEIDKQKLSNCLSYTMMRLFWLRLESMRRSKLGLGKRPDADLILKEAAALLVTGEYEEESGWMILGQGSSTNMLKLQGNELMKCLNLFPMWQNLVPKMGFLDAIRVSLDRQVRPCYQSRIIKYGEPGADRVVCEQCKWPVEKYIIYE
ncbi:hypothetical protein Ancab_021265 [Ancistrocladus abbreviatus]